MNQLFKLTYLRELCKLYGFSPSKQYGQNFLINDGIVKKIIEAGELKPTDTVVEIGPGFGVLTFALASRVKKVIAFEIERKLEKYWEKEIKDQEINGDKIEIIWGNALTQIKSHTHGASVFSEKSPPEADPPLAEKVKSPYKLIANIPYQITSNLLRTILELEDKPELIVVMVQKEVAQRICAKPPDMSLLAVSVQYYGEPKIVARVNKGNFWPSPKVDSAILRVKSLKSKIKSQEEDSLFFKFARAGFAQKRKQLWKNLADGLNLDKERVKMAIKEVMGDEKVRAEELSVDDWKRVVARLGDR